MNIQTRFIVALALSTGLITGCASSPKSENSASLSRDLASVSSKQNCTESLNRFLSLNAPTNQNAFKQEDAIKTLWEFRMSRQGITQFSARQKYSSKLFDSMLGLLQSSNGHLHPFMEMHNGTAVQARLAVKRSKSKPELLENIRDWMTRYQHYERDMIGLIQKTDLVVKNYKAMSSLEKLAPSEFPATVKLFIYREGKLFEEAFAFKSKNHLNDYLNDFRKVHWDRFDGKKLRAHEDFAYLEGRSKEQAELFGKLQVLKKELRKFSYYDNDELAKIEAELTETLDNSKLLPPARHQAFYRLQLFSTELDAYLGRVKIGSSTIEEMRFNDLYDMGINDSQLSIPKKLLRYGIITFPIQIVAVGVAAIKQYSGEVADTVETKYLDREAEDRIAKIENDDEFTQKLKEYLEIKYEAKFDGNKWNISAEGNASRLTILQKRKEHKNYLQLEKLALLAGDIEKPIPTQNIKILSPQDFKDLLSKDSTIAKELNDRVKAGEDVSTVTLEIYARQLEKLNSK